MHSTRWLAGLAALAVPASLLAAPAARIADDSTSSAVKLSGYVTASYFFASKPTGGTIVGRLYDRFHDQFIFNAARLTLQKSVATDKLDAGFEVDAVFGQNAPPIKSAGLSLGDQGDLPQAFITLNIPTGKDRYVQFRAGKMWTMLDVEVVDEVLNPNFSHGYPYIYLTDFTDTGIGVYAKFSAKVDAQVRIINGWDVVQDNNAAKSVMARLGVTPSDRVGLAFVGYLGPEQVGNTRNNRFGGEFVGTFKPASEATVYAQLDAGGEAGLGATGGTAKWWSVGGWGVYDLSPKASLALRGEYMDDRDGVRTSGVLGFQAAPGRRIGSGTVTLNLKSWEHALLRPELRIEHSDRNDFGNSGSLSSTQVTLGFAVSYIF
jgi:hypothetical protein